MHDLNTHKPSSLYEAFEPKEAKRIWEWVEFIFALKHGSWFNMAEIELNVLNGQCINRRIDNINTVKQEAELWQDNRNNKNSVINWRFKTKDARIELKRPYTSIEH